MNDAMIVNCMAYAEGRKLSDLTLENIPALLQDPADAFVWLGLREPDETLMAQIQALFGLHELAAEDAPVSYTHLSFPGHPAGKGGGLAGQEKRIIVWYLETGTKEAPFQDSGSGSKSASQRRRIETP